MANGLCHFLIYNKHGSNIKTRLCKETVLSGKVTGNGWDFFVVFSTWLPAI